MAQHGPVRGVAEGDVLQLHLPPDVRQGDGLRPVGRLAGGVQQAEHPLRRRQGGVDLPGDVGDLIDGPGELPGVEDEGGDFPQVDEPAHVQEAPQGPHQGQAQVVDEAHGGAHALGGTGGLPVGPGSVPVDVPEGLCTPVLPGVALDGPVAGKFLLHEAVHSAVGGGAPGEEGLGHPVHPPGVPHRQGDGHQGDPRQGGADNRHHKKGPGHRDDAGEDLGQVGGDAGGDHVHVVGHPADDVPGLVLVEVADRQLQQLVKNVPPHFFGDEPPGAHHAHVDPHRQQGGAQAAGQHGPRAAVDHGEVHLSPSRVGGADGPPRQGGPQQGEDIPRDDQQQDGRQGGPVVHEVGRQPAERAPCILGFFFFGLAAGHEAPFSGPLRGPGAELLPEILVIAVNTLQGPRKEPPAVEGAAGGSLIPFRRIGR